MKGHREASDAKAAMVLGLLLAVAALALAACGGSSRSGRRRARRRRQRRRHRRPRRPAASDPAQVARTESVVKAAHDRMEHLLERQARPTRSPPSALLSLYADDVQYYDAAAIDTVITKSEMDAMNRDPDWWKSFRVTLRSSFVSADGRFAATLGKIAYRDASGGLPWQPAVSVLAVANDKIVWECDYYGGEPGKAGQTTPMPALPSGAVAPGSPAARTAIAEATATIEQWLAAYNDRDAASFLSFYAEDAKYVDVVSPRWRIMTKSQLAADVASRFPRSEFAVQARTGTPGSAMGSSFFVSADGRFAAVQGTYADEVAGGGLVDQPMLVILELRAGQIIRQYNYVAVDRSLLQP